MQSVPGARSLASATGWLDRIAGSPWFAYGSIFLIQSKLLWGIWQYRDLTNGDTADYFVDASQWAHSLEVNPLWSPLYTALWGSTRWIVEEPYASSIGHRVVISIAATLVVLAVLRRFLSPGIAWAIAVWWALLPVNYDPLYELHVFALIPELAAVLIALTWTGLRMRAWVFGVLLLVAVLLRTEIAFALAIWSAAWLAYELWARRRDRATPVRPLAVAVAVPVIVVAGLMAFVVARYPTHDVWSQFEAKQSLNLCQSYAYAYQQRHDDFTGSPWLDCEQLMVRDFGKEKPTLAEAISANPGAIGEQLRWNAGLAPYGLQLMLFNRISGNGQDRNPDYQPVRGDSTAALLGSLAVVLVLAAGLLLLWRERDRWWRDWIRPRAWGWLALGSLAATIVPVMFLQRPRPEYLYCLSLLILSVVGLCAMVFADRWPALKRLRAGVPVAALLLVVLLPPHYTSGYQTPNLGRPGRPLKAMVDRLYPMREQLRGDEVHLVATYADAACRYVGEYDPCTSFSWSAIGSPATSAAANAALNVHGADYIYVDGDDLENPVMRAIVDGLSPAEWQRVGPPTAQGWALFRRVSTSAPEARSTSSPT